MTIHRDLKDHDKLQELDDWVFALSGGGMKGSFQVGVLLFLAQRRAELVKVHSIAGTSTGSISALAVSKGLRPGVADLLRFYLTMEKPSDLYEPTDQFRELDGIDGVALNFAMDGKRAPHESAPLPESFSLGVDTDELIFDVAGPIAGFSALGAALFGPIGAALGALFGLADEAEDAIEQVKRAYDGLVGLYSLDPIRQKIESVFDADEIRHDIRLVHAALEDGSTGSVDRWGALRRYLGDFEVHRSYRPRANLTRRLIDATIASSAIPFVNPPVRLQTDTDAHSYCYDGGVTNLYPVYDAIDLATRLPYWGPWANRIPEAGLSERLPQARRGIVAVGASPSLRFEWAPVGHRRSLQPTELDDLAGLTRRSIDMAVGQVYRHNGELLKKFGAPTVMIEPNVLVHGSDQVDPGLLRINIAYGYLMAQLAFALDLDFYGDDRDRQRLEAMVDLLTACRVWSWHVEENYSVTDLAFARQLKHAVRTMYFELLALFIQAADIDNDLDVDDRIVGNLSGLGQWEEHRPDRELHGEGVNSAPPAGSRGPRARLWRTRSESANWIGPQHVSDAAHHTQNQVDLVGLRTVRSGRVMLRQLTRGTKNSAWRFAERELPELPKPAFDIAIRGRKRSEAFGVVSPVAVDEIGRGRYRVAVADEDGALYVATNPDTPDDWQRLRRSTYAEFGLQELPVHCGLAFSDGNLVYWGPGRWLVVHDTDTGTIHTRRPNDDGYELTRGPNYREAERVGIDTSPFNVHLPSHPQPLVAVKQPNNSAAIAFAHHGRLWHTLWPYRAGSWEVTPLEQRSVRIFDQMHLVIGPPQHRDPEDVWSDLRSYRELGLLTALRQYPSGRVDCLAGFSHDRTFRGYAIEDQRPAASPLFSFAWPTALGEPLTRVHGSFDADDRRVDLFFGGSYERRRGLIATQIDVDTGRVRRTQRFDMSN